MKEKMVILLKNLTKHIINDVIVLCELVFAIIFLIYIYPIYFLCKLLSFLTYSLRDLLFFYFLLHFLGFGLYVMIREPYPDAPEPSQYGTYIISHAIMFPIVLAPLLFIIFSFFGKFLFITNRLPKEKVEMWKKSLTRELLIERTPLKVLNFFYNTVLVLLILGRIHHFIMSYLVG